jgi:peptide/nickel transport system permease protein
MGRFVVRRLLASIPVLFLVSLITFGLLWLVPGDPASVFLDASATHEALERVRHELGLDRPFLVRMGEWYVRLFQGDLGTSLLLNRSVTSAILERLPVTLVADCLRVPALGPAGSRGRRAGGGASRKAAIRR